jgi:hypothetical protein
MEERKVIKKEVEKDLVDIVLKFVISEGLTVINIKEAMDKVYTYFEGNATLEKATEI